MVWGDPYRRTEEEQVAEATRQVGARLRRALPALAFALLPLTLLAPTPAGASGSVSVAAHINGTSAGGSSQSNPVNLSPDRPASVSLRVTNSTAAPVTITTVRVEGTVIGLTFFSYDTSVNLRVRGATTLHFALDTSGLGGQAIGLIPGSVVLLNAQRNVVASQSMVTNVHGSLISVYGLFGLALLLLTVLAFADVLLAMARHRMSPNRWRRALRFLAPGIGLGLVLVFTLSALAVWIPSPGTWLVTVAICAAVFFVLGYLSPTPRALEEESDEDLDESEFLVPTATGSSEGGSPA